jgi:hypothetical protein
VGWIRRSAGKFSPVVEKSPGGWGRLAVALRRCGYCDVSVFAPRCEELGHSFEECGFKGGMVVKDLVGKIISPAIPRCKW